MLQPRHASPQSALAWIRPPLGVPLRLPRHPGPFLRRTVLVPLGLTQTSAAQQLGVSRRRLHEIVQGHRSMSPDTAIRCAMVFGADAAYLLQLQAAWDSFHAWRLLRQMARRGAHSMALAPSAHPVTDPSFSRCVSSAH